MHHLLETAYHKSPVWVQNLAVTALGYNLRRERTGAEGRALLETLRTSEQWSSGEIQDYVDARLRAIVAQAFEHVPYYRQLSERTRVRASDIRSTRDLWKLPIVDKEQIRRTPEAFLADPQARGDRLIKINTTGTTGTPLVIFCDVESRRRHYAFWTRLRGWFGITPQMYRATFFGRIICSAEQQTPPFWRIDRFQRNYLFSSYHLHSHNLTSYCDALRRLQPAEIIGYPSSLHAVALHILDRGMTDIRPRVVFTTAETLLPYQRPVIEMAFGTKVVDQYGAAEMVHFASECEHGTHHVHPEHGILEIVDANGVPAPIGHAGDVVCTGFVNRAMPLIRYRLGDRAVLGDGPCACRRNFPILADIVGRIDDVLMTPSGRPVGRMSPVFKGFPEIRAAQVVQPAVDRIIVKLVLSGSLSEQQRGRLHHEVAKRTGNEMHVDVEIVPEIPKEPSGKFRTVISLLRAADRNNSRTTHPSREQ